LGFLASKIHQLVAPSRAWESSDSWSWHGRSTGAKEAGNYGDPFGVQMYNDEMRMKELNNGRMAMISVLGIFAAECATGKDAIQQFGF
jgi:hypothetical protein